MIYNELAFIKVRPKKEIILEKGDIIKFDALGDGTLKRFRVLGYNDISMVATIVSLDTDLSTCQFNSSDRRAEFDNGNSYQDYAESVLDMAINNTYYHSLANNVQRAIIPTVRIQSCWAHGLSHEPYPDNAYYLRSATGTLHDYTRITQKIIGRRFCYALDIDDIIKYFNLSPNNVENPLNYEELWSTFFENNVPSTNYDEPWLATASTSEGISDYSRAFVITGDSHTSATMWNGCMYSEAYRYNRKIKPVFRIDLTNIDYTIEN